LRLAHQRERNQDRLEEFKKGKTVGSPNALPQNGDAGSSRNERR